MAQDKRFWLYLGNPDIAMLHRSDCGHCNNGHGRPDSPASVMAFWYGPYLTKGAAFDVAEAEGRKLQKDVCAGWE